MADPVRELLAEILNKIAAAEAECREDMARIDDECRKRKNDRWQRFVDETHNLHRMRCNINDRLSDLEAVKPITHVIGGYGKP